MTTVQHTGQLRLHPDFPSRHLGNSRTLIVFVPPGYDQSDARRYPVLYMHDGQNLFDPATAFGGNEWELDATAFRLMEEGRVAPSIIVGVYNTGDARIDEYTPTRDRRHRRGGKGDLYGRFLVEEVKPFIDASYNTLPSVRSTALGGSSLGGLITMFLGLRYPTVYGKLAVMSPSVWWDRRAIIREVEKIRVPPKARIWLDAGTNEDTNVIPDARRLKDALVAKGWILERNLKYVEVEGGTHSEGAWAARVGDVLRFLFPPSERRRTDREL